MSELRETRTAPRVLLLCGGKSAEHDVSISSARSLVAALAQSESPLRITTQVVSREGEWMSSAAGQTLLAAGAKGSPASAATNPMQQSKGPVVAMGAAAARDNFDVVFPLIHGTHGEDGTLQGLLELLGIPYVGAGVLGSAVCMDKVMSKDVLRQHDVPQVAYRLVTATGFSDRPDMAGDITADLGGEAWFVKPANMGSSVGISKCRNNEEVRLAIEKALHHDRRVIVEVAVQQARELEIGLLGNDRPTASCVGEISYAADFYDYESKYTDGLAQLCVPAAIPPQLSERIADLAQRAFVALDVAGLARVDFFYTAATDTLVLNELNTLPGFTPTSMFTKLWAHSGIGYPQLVERLVQLALQRHRDKT